MAVSRVCFFSALASAVASSLYDLSAIDIDGQQVPLMLEGNFGAQEPGTNAEIKKFAEQSVKLATGGKGSNVLMFAKSNLNNMPCTYSGEDACTAASNECCAQNDVVYKYLLANTPPGTIQWNFDKIVTDKSGKPYSGETIMHGGDVDAAVSRVVDSLLEETPGQLEAAPPVLSWEDSSKLPTWLLPIAGGLLVAAYVSWSGRARDDNGSDADTYIQIA